MAETRTLRDEWEVQPRLESLDLNKPRLLNVRTTAIGAAADATLYHPANAAGTFSYHQGVFALRNEFVGDVWKVDRTNGVETIRNDTKRVKIVFSNVDIACDDEHQPKPRSSKGSGTERLCLGNDLFSGLPHYFSLPQSGQNDWAIYYLMVASDGAVELSLPIVKGGTFKNFIERLYLSDGSDLDTVSKLSLDDKDIADDFDPKVARKK